MAFRTVRIRLFNMTNNSLTMEGDHLDHGEFTDHFSPPPTIIPDQLAEWRAESAGFMTGTEGEVTYTVDGTGDKVNLGWDNPAVGKTTFPYGITNANDGPSDFVFFTLHYAFDGSVERIPGEHTPLLVVTSGDLNEGTEIILPVPVGQQSNPHAWCDLGIRNKREPVSVTRWFKALGLDPSQGLRTIFNIGDAPNRIDVKELIELPV
jgi:hypothetical protein